MTSGLFDLDGGADPTLTGAESHALRALLQLERRHVAILAETVGETDVTTDRVWQWERSKGRGYPPAVVDRLRTLHAAVSELSDDFAAASGVKDAKAERLILVRPRGPGRIMTLLRLPDGYDMRFSDTHMVRLNESGGEFWQRLCDAAMVQAALRLNLEDDRPVHVALDTTTADD